MAISILYISYWGAHEGLTASTVIPNIKILCSFSGVEKIVFCSIERQPSDTLEVHDKVIHVPLHSKNHKNVLLNKISDFSSFQPALNNLCVTENINLIICRSSLAGIFGSRLFKKYNIPYVVESFEPHGEYMIEAGVWHKYGIRALINNWAERNQKKTARFLLPVSRHYFNRLVMEGVPHVKMLTMPCCISLHDFAFREEKRKEKRRALNLSDQEIVGIYVGKFGDIYHTTLAYDLFRYAFSYFQEKFQLVILTANDQTQIKKELFERGVPLHKVYIDNVNHHAVPDFLSAADFAFSTIKPSPARLYCSPIKNGEYWANGLPILMESGIGEDSEIMVKERGGVLLEQEHPQMAFTKLKEQFLAVGRKKVANDIKEIALRHRDFKIVTKVYSTMISRLGFS